jgi:serine/threonine protein kinase
MDGLTYMHSEQVGNFNKKMICHGDLKGVSRYDFISSSSKYSHLQNNYLVELHSADGGELQITGKITDFGLSHILDLNPIPGIESANSQVTQAIRWRAPEMAHVEEEDISNREKLLEKADIWSFALTALEVRTLSLSCTTS